MVPASHGIMTLEEMGRVGTSENVATKVKGGNQREWVSRDGRSMGEPMGSAAQSKRGTPAKSTPGTPAISKPGTPANSKRGRSVSDAGNRSTRNTRAKPRGNAARALAVLRRSAAAVLVVGIVGCVAGIATVPFLGYSPENPFADLAVAFLAPGLMVSFALWILYSVVSQGWVDDSGDWVDTTDKRNTVFRIAASTPMLLLALGAAAFGFAPLSDIVPWVNDLFDQYLGAAAIGLILLSVVVAAIAGAAVMGGRRAAIIGIIFSFGLIATVFGQYTDNAAWIAIGWISLAVSVAGYYMVGEISGYLPRAILNRFGNLGGAVLGAALAIIGFLTGQWLLGGLGACCVAAWLGIRIARGRTRTSGSPNSGD